MLIRYQVMTLSNNRLFVVFKLNFIYSFIYYLMLVKNKILNRVWRNCLNSIKTFSTDKHDEEDTHIFVSQQQIDYEKERRFLRDGKSCS